jgi:hypothetical protein
LFTHYRSIFEKKVIYARIGVDRRLNFQGVMVLQN